MELLRGGGRAWGRGSLGPRPSPLRDLLRAFNCAGEGNIETWKAWDETSRAHRRWVDAGSRAPRCLDHNYKRIHSRAFDARTVRVGVLPSYM